MWCARRPFPVRSIAALVSIGVLTACTVEAAGVTVVTTTTRLVRFVDTAGTIEVLDDHLDVERTIPVTHAALRMPGTIDGSALIDVRIDGTTVYDLRTGKALEVPIDDAGLEVMPGTPVDSPWKLIFRPDGGDLYAVNVATGEYVDLLATYATKSDSFLTVRHSGNSYIAGLLDTSVSLTFDGDRLRHRLVDGYLLAERGDVELSDEVTLGAGASAVLRLRLTKGGQQVGQRMRVEENDYSFDAELIDDTSALVTSDGRVVVHDFSSDTDREVADFPNSQVWIVSPDRMWVIRDDQPTLLIDDDGKTVAEFPAALRPTDAGSRCSLLSPWNAQQATLVDNNDGSVVASFDIVGESLQGADGCTTWSAGANATLVIDRRVVDLGFSGYVVDVSVNGREAIVKGNDGPVLLDTVTGQQTPLPYGDYRFAEL